MGTPVKSLRPIGFAYALTIASLLICTSARLAHAAGGEGSSGARGEVLWDNGFCDVCGMELSSERDTMVPLSTCADDFLIEGASWRIREIRALTLNVPGLELAGADVLLFEGTNVGDGPDDGRLIIEWLDLPVVQIDTGQRPTGFQLNETVIAVPPTDLPPGYYFLAVRGVGRGPHEGNFNFWIGSDAPEIVLDRGWFKSDYFGYPEWTPDEEVIGQPLDFLFRIIGEVGSIPGDFDNDGDVDIADFSLFAECFRGSGQGIPNERCRPADLDGDNDIDIADFSTFAENFTGSQ